MRHRSSRNLVLVTSLVWLASGVQVVAAPLAADATVVAHPLTGAQAGGGISGAGKLGEAYLSVSRGRRLFTGETFGGNGRTCSTCHDPSTGTTSPVEARSFDVQSEGNPGNVQSLELRDPLFRPIDSDDGAGDSYNRLLQHATIRVVIDLPPFMINVDDPSARSIVLNRGIPSTINSALLVPVLMQDGRESSLETQALDAVIAHAEPSVLPSAAELDDIANFERTLFSRPELADYSRGGPPPELPQATTPSEVRGRTFIARGGICNICHGGPMLNATAGGQRFVNILVSDLNRIGNPVYNLRVENQDGTVDYLAPTPDPGLALLQREAPLHQGGIYSSLNQFRIPTLWNVKATAPYFHDNSANTLEDVLAHYRQVYFPQLTDQNVADIIAYLKRL